MPEYSKEQLWKIYETLPEDLKEAIFSVETADNIYDICSKNGIEDNRISEVARYTGRVLLGILLPDDFQKTLEKEVKLRKTIAKNIADEINRFVFFPVRKSLTGLYEGETIPSPKPLPRKPAKAEPAESVETAVPREKPKKKDVYREPIE